MKPLLLIRPGGLGDVLVTLPALRLVRRAHSRSPLHFAARTDAAELLAAAGIIDAALSIDDPGLGALFSARPDPAALSGLTGQRPAALWAWLRTEPEPVVRHAVDALFERAGRIIVYDAAAGRTVSRFFFDRTAALLGLAPLDEDFDVCAKLEIPPRLWAASRTATALGLRSDGVPTRPFAVIHPGSGGAAKRWPPERFLIVAEALAGQGLAGLLVTGPAEGELSAELDGRSLPRDWIRAANPPLGEIAGLLGACALYLGNDSGVTHLAAAAGAPVLALFRTENLIPWRPFGRSSLIHASAMEEIAIEVVRPAALRMAASGRTLMRRS